MTRYLIKAAIAALRRDWTVARMYVLMARDYIEPKPF